jgi:hypothetical protein
MRCALIVFDNVSAYIRLVNFIQRRHVAIGIKLASSSVVNKGLFGSRPFIKSACQILSAFGCQQCLSEDRPKFPFGSCPIRLDIFT